MAATRKRIWIDLLLYPVHTLPTAAAPVLAGAGLAAHDGLFALLPVLVAFLGSWLIHVAGVFTDNHELLRRYPRIVEHRDLSNALAEKTLTLNQLRAAIAALLVLALPTAFFFLRFGGLPALVIGVIGFLASLAYAGGPVPYAKLGLAEPVFFLMFGIVAVAGTYYAQLAWLRTVASETPALDALPLTAFVVGLPAFGALVTNVLLIDDMRDRQFDAAKGWRTAAVRFGVRGSRIGYTSLSVLAYLAPFAFWAIPGFTAWTRLPLLTAPWAWRIGRTISTRDDPATLTPMTPRASLLACAYASLSAIGLAVTGSAGH